jgi:hypothetical protein
MLDVRLAKGEALVIVGIVIIMESPQRAQENDGFL